MASGKGHDRVNLFVGTILFGLMIGFAVSWTISLSFAVGWLMATLIFSPDSDIIPNKRAGPLRFFLYPYTMIFRHRGLSHSIWFGTMTRVFYSIIVLGVVIFIARGMGYIYFGAGSYFYNIWQFIVEYDYSRPAYQMATWVYLGMFLADLTHLLIDFLNSFFSRLFRFLC